MSRIMTYGAVNDEVFSMQIKPYAKTTNPHYGDSVLLIAGGALKNKPTAQAKNHIVDDTL